MAINRPNLPYIGVARQNYNYFKLLTANKSGVPAESLDGYFNFFTDQVNDIYITIAGINAGNLPGINDPNNSGKLLTTNGAGTQSWTLVQPSNILPHSITNDCIYPETITATELAIGGIGANQLAPNCVTSIKILDFNITTNKIANGAVTEEKIEDDAVTEGKIADDSVTTNKILDANITTDKILNANVTTAKIANDSITTAKILNDNVTTDKIANANVTAAKIANNTITAAQIDPNLLTGAAVKAVQIAAISTTDFTNPAVQQFHPSAAKFWCKFDGTLVGTNPPISGYNVATVGRSSSGVYIITFITPFSNSDYVVDITTNFATGTGNAGFGDIYSQDISSCIINTFGINTTAIASDCGIVMVNGYGLQ